MRGKGLSFTVAFATLVAVPVVARADEPAAAAAPPAAPGSTVPARSSVRRLIVDGDFASARILLERMVAGEIAGAERAAAAELSFVIDSWSGSGRPKDDLPRELPPMPSIEEDWQRAFSATRELLLSGAYAEAARRFERLVGTAPDLVAAARAAELRELARDALPAAAPEPPAARRGAEAPPSGEGPPQKIVKETYWYGWQTLILDGVAIVTTPFVPLLGLGIYALAPPLVHVGHGRPFVGLGDVGLRLGAPVVLALVGLVIGAAADGDNGGINDGAIAGAALGLVAGYVTAVVVDSAVLARGTVTVEKPETASAPKIVPILGPRTAGGGGLDVALGGTF